MNLKKKVIKLDQTHNLGHELGRLICVNQNRHYFSIFLNVKVMSF